MADKDLLVIDQGIVSKIIKQIYVEQKKLFTKKNYLRAKNDNKIHLNFNDDEVAVLLELDEEYIVDQATFCDVITFEIKSMIESVTNYRIKQINIKFNTKE